LDQFFVVKEARVCAVECAHFGQQAVVVAAMYVVVAMH
jgi:hypothetical protein